MVERLHGILKNACAIDSMVPILDFLSKRRLHENVCRFKETVEAGFARQVEYLGNDKPINRAMPAASVYVITYQHAPYICECLDSILQQKCAFPFEVIVGEDGSDDGTRELCMRYAEEHRDKIRLFLRNRPESACSFLGRTVRVNGWWCRMATRAPYIAICEGDDFWLEPDKLAVQKLFLDAHPDAVMHAHRANAVDVSGRVLGVWPEPQPEFLGPASAISRGGGFFATSSIMLRNALLSLMSDEYHTFQVGDAMLVNLAINHGRIGFSNRVMSAHRRGVPGSWTSRNAARGTIAEFKARAVLPYILLAQRGKHRGLYALRVGRGLVWVVRSGLAAAVNKMRR